MDFTKLITALECISRWEYNYLPGYTTLRDKVTSVTLKQNNSSGQVFMETHFVDCLQGPYEQCVKAKLKAEYDSRFQFKTDAMQEILNKFEGE